MNSDSDKSKSEASSSTTQQKSQTSKGGNPNKDKAVQKTFNGPRQDKNRPGKTYFADPDPEATPLETESFHVDDGPRIIGDFLVNGSFPFDCSYPYVRSLVSELRIKRLDHRTIQECINQLMLVVYVSAVSNVLNSCSAKVYGKYKAMRAFTNAEGLKLPKFLNAYMSILGNIHSKLGELELRYAEVYLEGWSTLALQYYQREPNDPRDLRYLYHALPLPIWRSAKGIEYIKQKFIAFFNDMADEFPVRLIDNRVIIAQVPKMTLDNFNDYVIQPEYRFKDNKRKLIVNQLNLIRDWIVNNVEHQIQFDGQDYLLTIDYNLQQIVDELSEAVDELNYVSFIPGAYFDCDDRIVTKSGSDAQLIASNPKNCYGIKSEFPIADGNAHLGYMVPPLKDLRYKTEYGFVFDYKKEHYHQKLLSKDRLNDQTKTLVTGAY